MISCRKQKRQRRRELDRKLRALGFTEMRGNHD
jgi:hypothetical protein